MRVLGLDPGLSATGYGLIEDQHVIEVGVLRSRRGGMLADRIQAIATKLETILMKHHPQRCGLENVFYSKNPKSAILASQLRGALILLLNRYQVPIVELAPTRIKLALTGNGRASKGQVQYMVNHVFSLSERLAPDAADALAIAYCAART
jgi:crossover junction endodeoxyribonuclease RuvC